MSLSNERIGVHGVELSRRRLLKLGALTVLASLPPCSSFAAILDRLLAERSLSFYNIHTGESLKAAYWANGRYLSEALVRINHILRDHRTGKTRSFDTRLLDLLYFIRTKLGAQQPFHIVSGYRSAKTNTLLRKTGEGVAVKSFHMYGKAVDVWLPHFSLSSLCKVAKALRGGGVGYYPQSGFVHLDRGPVRYWTG